jgi:H+/Cl- antiporter ClcA
MKILLEFINSNEKSSVYYALGFSVSLSLLSTTICYFNKNAEGSGIPELKCILAGVNMFKFLELKLFFAKIFALLLA